jgi:hypothetical protein
MTPTDESEDLGNESGLPTTNASRSSSLRKIGAGEACRHYINNRERSKLSNVLDKRHIGKSGCQNGPSRIPHLTHQLWYVPSRSESKFDAADAGEQTSHPQLGPGMRHRVQTTRL